jgi:hemolysin activation/secretion protein
VRSPLARIGGKSHLQGVLFADAGHAIPEGDGELDSVTMAGAGAGFRLALGAHAQFLADYGLAVAGSDDVEEQTGLEVDSGRLHVCATVQF